MIQTTSNFNSAVQSLRDIGVESFDIFTKEELAFLTDDNYQLGKYNDNLAGHIKKEVKLKWPKEFEDKLLLGVANSETTKKEVFKHKLNNRDSAIMLNSLWINYQSKHEFNPIHVHTGLLSFVLFLQIPYDLTTEENLWGANIKETSKLQFLSVDPSGQIITASVDVDKSFEGKLVMFSSSKCHQVYPFYTSDDYRITVSGNICFNIDEEKV